MMTTDNALSVLNALNRGAWSESSPGALICNPDPVFGGIIDQVMGANEWFVIFNAPSLEMLEGFDSREEAATAFAILVIQAGEARSSILSRTPRLPLPDIPTNAPLMRRHIGGTEERRRNQGKADAQAES